jgi:hypothetical protein
MIRVEYIKRNNALRYATNREMKQAERLLAEQYILLKVAPETDFYQKQPSKFVYLGTEKRLKKRLVSFHYQNDMSLLSSQEEDITASVNDLIKDSMISYYAEKIGDLLVSARSDLKGGATFKNRIVERRHQMHDLIEAYNQYAPQKIRMADVVPSDLKAYWLGEEGAERYATQE